MGNTKNDNLIFRYKLFLAVTHSMTFAFLEMYKLSLICLIFISKRFTQIFVCDTKLTGEIGYIFVPYIINLQLVQIAGSKGYKLVYYRCIAFIGRSAAVRSVTLSLSIYLFILYSHGYVVLYIEVCTVIIYA